MEESWEGFSQQTFGKGVFRHLVYLGVDLDMATTHIQD